MSSRKSRLVWRSREKIRIQEESWLRVSFIGKKKCGVDWQNDHRARRDPCIECKSKVLHQKLEVIVGLGYVSMYWDRFLNKTKQEVQGPWRSA